MTYLRATEGYLSRIPFPVQRESRQGRDKHRDDSEPPDLGPAVDPAPMQRLRIYRRVPRVLEVRASELLPRGGCGTARSFRARLSAQETGTRSSLTADR